MVIPIDLLQTTQLFILPPVELVVAVLDDELEELEDIFVELFVELFVGSIAVWLLVVVWLLLLVVVRTLEIGPRMPYWSMDPIWLVVYVFKKATLGK